MTTTAKLGDVPLLANQAVSWSLAPGTRPVSKLFQVTPGGAEALEALVGRPITLTFQEGGTKFEAKNLWIVGFPENRNPHIRSVQVSDRRVWWSYVHVVRSFNVRKRVEFRRVKNDAAVQELEPVRQVVHYQDWSINPPGLHGLPWKAHDAFRDVLKQVLEREKEAGGTVAPVSISPDIKDEQPVDDLVLDDSGEAAVLRLLGYLPSAGVTVDLDGTVRVYSRASGRGPAEVDKGGPEIFNEGHISLVTHEAIRPSEVRVLFTREVEVRFDSQERDSYRGHTSVEVLSNDRSLDNVLPIPDHELIDVNDGGVVFNAAQGTWIDIDAALDAWQNGKNGRLPALAGVNGQKVLDHDYIRRAFVPFLDLWTGMGLLGIADPDADWSARISAIQQHYRQTYRINQRWMAKVASIRANRLTTIDPANGTRGPALCYSDYTVIPSMRAWFKDRAKSHFAVVIDRGLDPGEAITAETKPAAARVSVADSDQGILRADYVLDPCRLFDSIIPGKLSQGTAPTGDFAHLRKNIKNIAWNGIGDRQVLERATSLAPEHRISFLVTVIPGAPNHNGRLHEVTVKPGDIREMLPASAQQGLGNAKGPPMEVRVLPGVRTAKIRWQDARVADIEAIFGLGAKKVPDLQGLVTNQEAPGKKNVVASIDKIARAVAARVYAGLADREVGTAGYYLAPDIRIEGWLEDITTTVEPSGQVATAVESPPAVESLPLSAYLDDASRKKLEKIPPGLMP